MHPDIFRFFFADYFWHLILFCGIQSCWALLLSGSCGNLLVNPKIVKKKFYYWRTEIFSLVEKLKILSNSKLIFWKFYVGPISTSSDSPLVQLDRCFAWKIQPSQISCMQSVNMTLIDINFSQPKKRETFCISISNTYFRPWLR